MYKNVYKYEYLLTVTRMTYRLQINPFKKVCIKYATQLVLIKIFVCSQYLIKMNQKLLNSTNVQIK